MMKRSSAFPLLALMVVAITFVANLAVYRAGVEWFVQRPSIWIVVRNVVAVALLLGGGWTLLPPGVGRRVAGSVLALASVLFGIGLAVQFRLGQDAPRQLDNDEIVAIRDSVRAAMPGAPEDSARRLATIVVRGRNSAMRRDFEAARVDTRLARSLESAYGETELTRPILADRSIAPMDDPILRFLPVIAALVTILLFGRTNLPVLLTARWREIGFYGSLLLCVAVLVYLTVSGGVRGANFAPQELLKLLVPIGWAGFLIHYRGALLAESRERFTANPLALWLYVLALLTVPLAVFIVVRDFGQFLTIALAQVLLLAYFTRSALYVVLATVGLAVTVVLLLGGLGESLWMIPAILVVGVTILAWLERFRRRDVLWTSGALVLAAYSVVAFVVVQLPFVRRMVATPRQRFLLWADLFSRHGDAGWWDRSRQIVESLYAFDAGGLLGRGLGHGTPFLIPKAGSDFIFAAIAEELGVLGGGMIVLAFAVLAVLGLRIAREQGEESFVGLVVAGYIMLLSVQAVVHIGGTMNLMPMTGITLPLVSSGLSSMVVSWGMIGAVVGLAGRRLPKADDVVIRRDLQGRASSR